MLLSASVQLILASLCAAAPQVNLQNQTFPGLTQISGFQNQTQIPGMEEGQLPGGQLPVEQPGVNLQNQTFPGATQIGGFQNQTQLPTGQLPGQQSQAPGLDVQNQTFPGLTQIGGFQNQTNIEMPSVPSTPEMPQTPDVQNQTCGLGGNQLPTGQLPGQQSQAPGLDLQNQTFPELTQIGGLQNQTQLPSQLPGGDGGQIPGANGQMPEASVIQNQTFPGTTQIGGLQNQTNIQVPGSQGGNINLQNQSFPSVSQIGGGQNSNLQFPSINRRNKNNKN